MFPGKVAALSLPAETTSTLYRDGTVETEVAIKEATKATIRCIPIDAPDEEGVCVFSGKPSHRRVLFARSY